MNILKRTRSALRRSSHVLSIALGTFYLFISSVQAEQSINLEQALQRTLAQNPQLQAYPLMIRGAEAMGTQASLSPIPKLSIEVENALGSGEFKSFDNAQINLTLSQTVELGEKRQNRLRFANSETQQLKREYELSRLDILAETSRRYYQVLALQAQQSWAKRRVVKERNALGIIEKRAKAGAVGQADVSKMALRLTRSEALQEKLTADLNIAKTRLASMWMTNSNFDTVDGQLDTFPSIPTEAMINDSVNNLPGVLNQIALQRIADYRVDLAKSNGQSDMTFGVGIRQHQSSGDQSLNFSFSMPLAFKNPNKGRIQAAQAKLDLSIQQSEWIRQQLRLTLLETRQHLTNLMSQANRMRQKMLPQAQKLLRETENGYQKGRYSVLQWVDAQSELFSIERAIIQTHQQIYLQFLELERITGQSMSNVVTASKGEKS
ncbi:TolC family protein [Aliikangiella coralliicola]|nr:TolC family protein [Aliikangiella coralliicola]